MQTQKMPACLMPEKFPDLFPLSKRKTPYPIEGV